MGARWSDADQSVHSDQNRLFTCRIKHHLRFCSATTSFYWQWQISQTPLHLDLTLLLTWALSLTVVLTSKVQPNYSSEVYCIQVPTLCRPLQRRLLSLNYHPNRHWRLNFNKLDGQTWTLLRDYCYMHGFWNYITLDLSGHVPQPCWKLFRQIGIMSGPLTSLDG